MSSFIAFPRKVVGLMICWSCLFRLCMEQTAVSCSSSFCNRYVRFANYLFSLTGSCDCTDVKSVDMCRAAGQPGHANLLAGQQLLTRFCSIASPKKVGVYMGWRYNAEMLLTMDMGVLGRPNCSWEPWRIARIAALHGEHEEQRRKQRYCSWRQRLKSKWASRQCVTIAKLDNSYTFSSTWARCPLYALSSDST